MPRLRVLFIKLQMPVTVRITLGLLIFLASCWCLFGFLVVTGAIVITQSVPLRLAMGAAAIACSLVIGLSTFCMYRGINTAYLFITVLMGVILLVSFMDDLGWVDFTMIGITAFTFGLLIKDRRWYRNKNMKTPLP